MPDFYTHSDDGYSDPEVIGVNYQVQKNAFFEVQLTLAEFTSQQSSGGGGVAGSPGLIAAQGGGGGQGEGTCPEKNEYIWMEYGQVKAGSLVGKSDVRGYNPITRNLNKLLSARLIKNVPLNWMVSGRAKSLVSTFHQYIEHIGDRVGENLKFKKSGSALSFDEYNGNLNCFHDRFGLEAAGRGDVVELSFETEWIYITGHDKKTGIVSHNKKII